MRGRLPAVITPLRGSERGVALQDHVEGSYRGALAFLPVRMTIPNGGLNRGRNVLGGPLAPCCHQPRTGFYRDGYCATGPEDIGSHTVCARVTAEFLAFTASRGNDLSTPAPQFNFPGLRPGDKWCLCASRWKEAYDAGVAPPVILEACHENALRFVPLAVLREFSLDQRLGR
ncbi:hypothetical protein F1559_002883 [Cyanidiococcus yangmingshanensis]|uniref:DUF2237 domain-containing protein n=1 Tax=Cyanidiococcus yangmingshanensis TaxID=2690220 RepID=A0A7J7IKC9_9RHOD|nr:hypothetical protein F1559_002883 [Cyanidiococcus yangmingshanensis]